jgi:hypothetical protein
MFGVVVVVFSGATYKHFAMQSLRSGQLSHGVVVIVVVVVVGHAGGNKA